MHASVPTYVESYVSVICQSGGAFSDDVTRVAETLLMLYCKATTQFTNEKKKYEAVL